MHLTFKKGAVMVASLAMLLTACNSSLSYKKGEKVYVYDPDSSFSASYDLSKEAYNINILLNDKVSSVKAVSLGREKAASNQFGFKNGILTLSGEFLSKVASGEKELSITPSKGRDVKVPILMCDKFIETAQDFQDINNELDGTYALVNDIDFSNFGNFEPLGRYVTETDKSNHYFHGILEGNGYALKNMQVFYSMNPTTSDSEGNIYDTNQDAYEGSFGFTDVDAHRAGNNVGVFNFIGSSGVVRNLVFDNVKVRGRAIVGIVAGNCSGELKNILIKENCSAKANSHFYDNNCNVGGAIGIVGGSGKVSNVVSLTSNVSISKFYVDYNDDYSLPENDEKGNGWDHVPGSMSPTWKYAASDRVKQDKTNEKDSNGSNTNGVYSVIGKSWGTVKNSIGKAFDVTPTNGTKRSVFFGQTHLGVNDNGSSGSDDSGQLVNCEVYNVDGLKLASNYAGFDALIWNIQDGSYPSLKAPQIKTGTIQ